MKSVPVLDTKGKPKGKMSLDQSYFDGKINRPLLHQAVSMYMANLRKGSASTKARAQVRGGGRKPWRQKGTGRARTGSIRNPLWRGGGVVFGPHPREYRYSVPKTVKALALKQSLNGKVRDGELIVVDNLVLESAKTKDSFSFLKSIKAEDNPLIVTEKHKPNIIRTTRNIPGAEVKAFNNINAYDILKHKKVVFTKQALENLVKLRKH